MASQGTTMTRDVESELAWLLIANVMLFCVVRSTFSNDNVDVSFQRMSKGNRDFIVQLLHERGPLEAFRKVSDDTLRTHL
jgi:hypothetical protein